MFLRQSTASQEVSLGYFLDTTDGNTEETGLTIANTDIKIRKGGGTTLTNKNSGGATHISNGIYSAVLDATDTNTLGDLVIYCHPTGALATKIEYTVLPAASYDALIVNGLNDLSAAQVNTEVDTGLSDYDGPTNTEMEARTVTSSTYATAANLATVDGIVDAILVDTGTTLPATLTDIAGSGFVSSTDSNEAIRNRGDLSWVTGGGGSAPTVSQIRTEMDDNSTKLAAIVGDTNELQTNQGNFATATGFATTAEIADVPTVAEFNARTIASSNYATAANLSTVDGIVDSILVDTNELQGNQGDWATATGFATTAEIANVPTVAEFEARTLIAAGYFDASADTVARVTLVDTTTTNTDMLSASDVLTTQMTESYAADGTAPTLAQAIFLSMQNLQDFSFAGTTQTVKRIDGSTTAATYTLDDATAPTSKTRAT